MIYYLICFSSSLFLLWFGQKIRYGQCELFRWFVYGIALLIPAILAGVRDWSIGTDTEGYAYSVFKEACTGSHIGSFSKVFDGWIGVGYLWLNITMSKISDNFNVVLFSIIFIEIIFVFLTIYQWRDIFPIWLGMLVFYTFFFNMSFNLIRQCLALSIAFFGIRYIFERKFLFFVFWILLGSLFHNSVLLLLVYYPLFWYANKWTSKKSTLLFSLILTSLIIFSNQIFIPLLDSISDIVPKARVASVYLDYKEKEGGYKTFIYYVFLVILFLYKRKTISEHFPDIWHFLEITVIIAAIAQLLVLVSGEYGFRYLVISNWWLCFLIPIIFHSYNKTIPRIFVNVMIIFYCFFQWYYTIIYKGANETQNYSSSILSSIF
jgi:hypothetical protein